MVLEGVVLFPAIIYGLIVGIIEVIFVHADQDFRGSHWFMHGLHAMLFAIIFIFITMNVPFVLGLINWSFPYQQIIVLIIVAIIAFVKIQAASMGAGKAIREKLWHTLIIVLLIIAAPYIWKYLQPVCLRFLSAGYC
jgi:hypothetical protein